MTTTSKIVSKISAVVIMIGALGVDVIMGRLVGSVEVGSSFVIFDKNIRMVRVTGIIDGR